MIKIDETKVFRKSEVNASLDKRSPIQSPSSVSVNIRLSQEQGNTNRSIKNQVTQNSSTKANKKENTSNLKQAKLQKVQPVVFQYNSTVSQTGPKKLSTGKPADKLQTNKISKTLGARNMNVVVYS